MTALYPNLVDESSKTCIFWKERIVLCLRYPPALVPEGRIRRGEALLFPNLFAIGATTPLQRSAQPTS